MLPIERLGRALHRFLRGVPDDEEARCSYCRATIAPFSGERGDGRAYCDEDCATASFERLA